MKVFFFKQTVKNPKTNKNVTRIMVSVNDQAFRVLNYSNTTEKYIADNPQDVFSKLIKTDTEFGTVYVLHKTELLGNAFTL